MSLVKIPFCHLPNTLFQTVNTETMLRTKFQIDELVAVAARPDFAYFVTTVSEEGTVVIHEELRVPRLVMWYDKSGRCHAARLGANKVLDGGWRLVGNNATPTPLDSPVYATRTTPNTCLKENHVTLLSNSQRTRRGNGCATRPPTSQTTSAVRSLRVGSWQASPSRRCPWPPSAFTSKVRDGARFLISTNWQTQWRQWASVSSPPHLHAPTALLGSSSPQSNLSSRRIS